MSREAGKGSKSRPLSVTGNQFENNWNLIFSKKMTKKPVTPSILTNPLNQEIWWCSNVNDIHSVDGVEYITVYKESTPNRTHLMRKDALRKLT
jgi:hypothetical protein